MRAAEASRHVPVAEKIPTCDFELSEMGRESRARDKKR